MAIKKILMQKKIAGAVYDIYAKTSADIVEYQVGKTVADALAETAEALTTITTDTTGTIDTRIKAATDDLYNKIMGFTDTDKTIDEAYDTLKEVAAYLAGDDGAAAKLASLGTDVALLQTEVEKATTGLLDRVTALEGTVGNATSGLVKDVADNASDIAALQTTVGGTTSGLVKDVNDLKTTVGDSTSGLVKDVAALQAASTDVVESTTNGNIVVDGEEVVVYTHPDTHSADMITETTDKVFLTAAERTRLSTVGAIVDSADALGDYDLAFVEIA